MKSPKVFKVRPKLAYKLLGTDIQLDPDKIYGRGTYPTGKKSR
jgi:hypothetical protein